VCMWLMNAHTTNKLITKKLEFAVLENYTKDLNKFMSTETSPIKTC